MLRSTVATSANDIDDRIHERRDYDEYMGFCNNIFPSDRCALIAEFGGNMLSIYELSEPIDTVLFRIGQKGREELLRAAYRKEVSVEHAQAGTWRRLTFNYTWFNGEDLFESRENECYVRAFGRRTIVLCFGFPNKHLTNADFLPDFLSSVEFPVSD